MAGREFLVGIFVYRLGTSGRSHGELLLYRARLPDHGDHMGSHLYPSFGYGAVSLCLRPVPRLRRKILSRRERRSWSSTPSPSGIASLAVVATRDEYGVSGDTISFRFLVGGRDASCGRGVFRDVLETGRSGYVPRLASYS